MNQAERETVANALALIRRADAHVRTGRRSDARVCLCRAALLLARIVGQAEPVATATAVQPAQKVLRFLGIRETFRRLKTYIGVSSARWLRAKEQTNE